jgi:hypothetical protein
MNSVLQDILMLMQLFGVALRSIRHTVKDTVLDLVSGAAAQVITIRVPPGQVYVITRISLEGYPVDGVGNYLQGERRPDAYADTVRFQWVYNGQPENPATDHHFWKGDLFITCPTGTIKLLVDYTALGSSPAEQRLYLHLNGYMVDARAISGTSGEGGGGSVRADFGQTATLSASN